MAAPFRAINDTKGVALTGSPHSQAIVNQGLVFCGGQLPMDGSSKLVEGDMQAKTRQCLSNMKAVLENAGSSISLVIKTTVFVVNMNDFAAVNEEYAKWFIGNSRPARSCVAVRELPRGAQVEIECIARVDDSALSQKMASLL